jgi:hypothetical protein
MLDFILNNKYFKEITLEKSGVLFNEWDLDNNLYIIKSWSLSIQKYTTIEKDEIKQLAILNKWEIFWEWALKKSEPKQVQIVAIEDSVLYKIDAKEWIKWFISEFPKEWIELLNEIIDTANKRLLESNFLVTSSYQMSKTISELDKYNNKNLFIIIDKFEKIIWSKYILYLEKNLVIEKYVTIKYDSRINWKMLNNIIELKNNVLDIDIIKKEWILLEKFNHIEPLKNKNETIGFLIIWEWENNLSEWKKKAITFIWVLIAWYIRQKMLYEELFPILL